MNQTPSFDQSNPEGAINPSSLRPDQIKGLCDVVAAIHDRSVGAKEEGETLCADWLLKLTSKALGLGPTELSTQLAAQSSTPGAVWQDTGENDGMRAPEQSDLGGGQTDVDPSQVKAPWSKQVLIDLCTVKTWIECHVSGKAPVSLITSDAALFVLKGAIEAVRGATRVANTAELKADPLWPTDGVYPDMAPPASQRDRWMFDQGRLAERRAVAAVAAESAQGHRVAGWIQFIDGVQTQNFARDENELKLIDRLSGRVRAEGSEITYQAVYTLNLPAPLLKDS